MSRKIQHYQLMMSRDSTAIKWRTGIDFSKMILHPITTEKEEAQGSEASSQE